MGEINQPSNALDVYKVMLEELHRRQLDSREVLRGYDTILVILLAAEAYLAVYSDFTNWLSVIAVTGISVFALLLLRHRVKIATANSRMVADSVIVCLQLERQLVQSGTLINGVMENLVGITKDYSQPKLTLGISHLYQSVFVTIPLSLAVASLLAVIPQTHTLIHPLLTK